MAPSLTDPRPRRVLVVVASRHGATREIAGAVAGALRAAGLDVHVESALSDRPVRLFSSGPVGDPRTRVGAAR